MSGSICLKSRLIITLGEGKQVGPLVDVKMKDELTSMHTCDPDLSLNSGYSI